MKPLVRTLPVLLILIAACTNHPEIDKGLPLLKVAENKHYIVDENNNPFFWLGDTGWLIFKKLKREEAKQYFEDRAAKGFNVVQVMVIHSLDDCKNIYGDSAFVNKNISEPLLTEGDSFEDSLAYDYWDHVDYLVKLAGENGIFMAMVPLWGSNVKLEQVNTERMSAYGKFLAERYKNYNNIIWLNGGDTFGCDSTESWNALGVALNTYDTNHLITFHPRGRMQSSMWFHNEEWMDFNMIQSGHRTYDQDDTELNYGEDNWRYIETDYALQPIKPVIDGEPSYEGIPYGLHDTTLPRWNDDEVRRYAYWSVFAGAFGYTYGHSAVMQFYSPIDKINGNPGYGDKLFWDQAINEPGAQQMHHIKDLMLSRPFLERVPDQSLIAEKQGERYNYIIGTRGENYAMLYTYTGRTIPVAMGKIAGEKINASWFDPRTGEYTKIGEFENSGIKTFDAPGDVEEGNDWVLVLDGL